MQLQPFVLDANCAAMKIQIQKRKLLHHSLYNGKRSANLLLSNILRVVLFTNNIHNIQKKYYLMLFEAKDVLEDSTFDLDASVEMHLMTFSKKKLRRLFIAAKTSKL